MKPSAIASAAGQAALLGALAAWLTFSFTNPLGQPWVLKDYVFVLAVMGAVFYHRLKSMTYEQLVNAERRKRLDHGTDTAEASCWTCSGLLVLTVIW